MTELVEQIDALLALNAKGAVSHPVPGLAVELLERAKDALSRRSGSNTAGGDADDEDLASDDRWNKGVNYAIERLCEILSVDPKAISWDAATETVNGDVMSVICNVLVAAYGEEWSGNERETAAIRAALEPIQAGGDEPVAWWDVQEFKVWKGIDPEKPVWHSRGFCCRTWADANDLLEYLQHNSPETLLRVTLSPHSASPSTRPATPVSAEVTEAIVRAVKPYTITTLFVEELREIVRAALATLDRGRG